MRRAKMFLTAFLIGVLCWTPVMQPFAAYAQIALADSPASGSSDDSAESQQGGEVLPDAGDFEGEVEQGLALEPGQGAVEQPDAEGVDAESDDALQSTQDDTATSEVDDAADEAAVDNTANGFLENSWRYENGVLRADLEPSDRSLYSRDVRPEGATAWGIDVSNHQGSIDWAKVKAAGVDYAILRCGFGEGIMDDSFIRNVQGCKKYGIPFGVYLYCYAWDAKSAREEAEGTLSILSRAGVKPSDLAFPVYYDIENTVGNKNHPDYGKPAGVDGNNQYHVIRNNATFTAMAETYCNIIQNAGFEPGVYASLNWWRNYLNDAKFNSWDRWVAQYYSECTYEGTYSMWQYSSVGRVDGIRGNVDVNWYFKSRYSVGWYLKDGSWYYRLADGTNRTGWLSIKGETYWLDPSRDGECASGLTMVEGSLYHFDPSRGLAMSRGLFSAKGKTYYAKPIDGRLISGWQFVEGEWYFFDSAQSCAARTGWYDEAGNRYHFDGSGVMARGWCLMDDSWYRFDYSGAMRRGWVRVGSYWYHLASNGKMDTGWLDEGSVRYYLLPFGGMCTGWRSIDGSWYSFAPSGAMRRGWLKQGGVWYLLQSDGRMAVGAVLHEGRWSRFESSGRWIGYISRSWAKSADGWYYVEADGSSGKGWRFVGSEWYYLDPSAHGLMKTGWFSENGTSYYLKESGAMARGWARIDGKWYLFNPSGAMLTGWQIVGGRKYYLGDDGIMLSGRFYVDGVEYVTDSSGALLVDTWISNDSSEREYIDDKGSIALKLSENKLYQRCLAGWKLVTGPLSVGGRHFMATEDGIPVSGWAKDSSGHWLYFDANTYFQHHGWLKLGSTWYYLDNSTGVMATGWLKNGTKWYYLGSSGAMQVGWLKDGDYWYYLSSSHGGAMLTGTHMIDGYRRRFNPSGQVDKYGYQNPNQYYQVSSWNVPAYRQNAGIFSFVSRSRITVEATRSQIVEAFIARAYDYLGTKYIWNYACAPSVGVDCAGLVNQCFYAVGMDTIYNPYLHWHDPWQSHNAENMRADSKLMHVDYSQRRRGDLIFYPGHVAIYLGNDQIIEAIPPKVRVSSIGSSSPVTGVARPFL